MTKKKMLKKQLFKIKYWKPFILFLFILACLIGLADDFYQSFTKLPTARDSGDPPQDNQAHYGTYIPTQGNSGSILVLSTSFPLAESNATTRLDKNGNSFYVAKFSVQGVNLKFHYTNPQDKNRGEERNNI